MVGKGIDTKSSRIFQQCYLKCCKLQNVTPLNNVIPSANGKVVDFCVDRIKYVEWPPILNALSCDLSLHSVSIKCRQQVKTVLEHVDCERLAKSVTKRCVLLTKFMLSNLLAAVTQLLADSTLLTSLTLEGLPLRIPYINPLCEVLLNNHSLQHLFLPRCLLGDAGCAAVCSSIRSLPNILTLDLSGCEITAVGAAHITDLIRHQKIHRYSENWVHTLRYRPPELDAMAGLRRLSLSGNPLGDQGLAALLDVLADDLWIKALDVQRCGVGAAGAEAALRALRSNTALVVLDLRHNPEVRPEQLAQLRARLHERDRAPGAPGQFSWLSSGSSGSSYRLVRTLANRNGVAKDCTLSNMRNLSTRNNKSNFVKMENESREALEEQLQEEISHRQQLEELNVQLVEQMRELRRQHARRWSSCAASSGSEHSLQVSSPSGPLSSCSGSTSSVPIEHSTLAYIQQAFRDIYTFIKNNQCEGQCVHTPSAALKEQATEPCLQREESSQEEERSPRGVGRAQRARRHRALRKVTQSAHLLRDAPHHTPDMVERCAGDSLQQGGPQRQRAKHGAGSSGSSVSSDTLCARPHPRRALCSSGDESDSPTQ